MLSFPMMFQLNFNWIYGILKQLMGIKIIYWLVFIIILRSFSISFVHTKGDMHKSNACYGYYLLTLWIMDCFNTTLSY